MQNNLINPQQALNKVYFNTKIIRAAMDNFKIQMITILDAINEQESEEFHKNLVISFLKKTFYDPLHFVNTKGRNDLVIHNGKDAKTSVGVIVEVKSPVNKTEMITVNNLNGKALQELVLYYLRERITHKNTDLKHLVVTNIYEWFVFDAHVFNKLFAENKKLVKDFIDFEEKRTSGKTTDFFYKEIAKPYIENIKNDIVYTYFNINQYDKPLRNNDPEDDKLLVSLYKLISPEHLLKQPFANDNNTLDRGFYEELLHIIGLTEIKDGGKKIIVRHEPKNRNAGSLLENAIVQLESLDKISRIKNPKNYGDTQDEILFGVALELCITWINRILFLKLLEAQIITYHKNDKNFSFLNSDLIKDYGDLNKLFFQVLAEKVESRSKTVAKIFENVPYLNSSLFITTDLEHEAISISGLDNNSPLQLLPTTVIKDNLKKKTGNLNTLEYLLSFLDAYDFATDVNEKFKNTDKKLINAAVLGLIFEKINGYKEGSFFTPSFITMYMCKETIRRAVVQKFNEIKDWNCNTFDELRNKIEDIKEANAIVNKLKICDPAVGSGHFLVSALNEIIVIKHDLRILQDKDGIRLKEYDFEIVNDELITTDEDGLIFQYKPKSKESQRIQETLFHEKRTIIENCLFGVDINPNSVKICQLRLWIELLKNAYYHFGTTDLETFPNIDINIKCGNSLISRFGLDSDLKKALKNSKWTIETYKNAVSVYQNAQNKEEKRGMLKLIEEVKENFTTEIATNDPKKLKLEKAKGDLFNKTNQTGMFDLGRKEQDIWNKQINILTAEIQMLETEIDDLKNNRIYDRAFEWRFEFPQVLNDDGDFIGFDVVIGNPPYISGRDFSISQFATKKYFQDNYLTAEYQLDLYQLFIELSERLTSNEISLIIPNTWLANHNTVKVRNFILNTITIKDITYSLEKVFKEADVDVIIFQGLKQKSLNSHLNINCFIDRNITYKQKIFQNRFENTESKVFDIYNNDVIIDLIKKIEIGCIPISKIADINRGVHSYRKDGYGKSKFEDGFQTEKDFIERSYHSKIKLDQTYIKEIRGKHICPYYTLDSDDFVSYGSWLAEPRALKYFQNKRIYLRKILGSNGLIASIVNEMSIADQSVYIALINDLDYFSEYTLCILNSKLIGKYFRFKNNEFDILFPQIKVNEFKSLPIKVISKKAQQPFIKLVDTILSLKKANPQADTLALEQEIDVLVYDLYGLTEEEIMIVEGK